MIETNPDAEQTAADLDNERAQGSIRGPFHDVPVLIKDNLATKDKLQTTAGSWALLGSKVPVMPILCPNFKKLVPPFSDMRAWVSGHPSGQRCTLLFTVH